MKKFLFLALLIATVFSGLACSVMTKVYKGKTEVKNADGSVQITTEEHAEQTISAKRMKMEKIDLE